MRLRIAFLVLTITTPVYAQTLGSMSGASSIVQISNPSSTTSTSRVVTAPTIASPGLTAAGIETCLGSAAGGVSLMGGGVTFGSTKIDEGCTIRLLARQLFAFGFQKAAVALMCQDEHVAEAMAAADSPCPNRPDETRKPLRVLAYAPETALSAAPADINEPIHASAFMPVKPLSPEEQAWFDRASSMN